MALHQRTPDPPPVVDIRSLDPRKKPMDGVSVIDPIMIRAVDCAKALSISKATLYRMVETGQGPPAMKFGRGINAHYRFHYKSVLEWAALKNKHAMKEAAKRRRAHEEDED